MPKRPSAHIALLVAVAAGLLVVVLLPGRAAAATPCWKRVLNDWSNGRAIGTYPLHCYRDALRNLPEDLRDYSSASDDIQAALQAQIAKRNVRVPQINPTSGSSGSGGSGSSGQENATKTTEGQVPKGTELPARSAYRKAIDNLGTSNADAVPIPLLVLASLGAFLLLLAASLAATKRVRALRASQRRGPPGD
jgi:hypothetical protein